MNVCTIIAKNYLAPARVLARSLRAAHPDCRVWTLVIDDFDGYLDPASEPFEVLTPADVGCEPFVHMALRYSILELSTAVKPWLLRHLLEQTGEVVTYLDPDIQVFGSLQRLVELAERHGVVLTPHNLRPIPQDGRTPSQVDVMIAGIYNLGYVSLAPGPEVERLIDWWADRLRRDCRVDPVWGYFVDQRWFDLAPGFMSDLAILREPQYNVAYWNLHERDLARAGDGYAVDGRPLAFFHFSGFDPERPLVLSRHQSRIDVTERPVLESLLAGYADALHADGHAEARAWPYSLARLGDGGAADDELRALFDEYATARSDDVASPFTAAGMAAFDAWLIERAPGAPAGVTRAMARVYRDRSDVRGAFPDLAGGDREPFLKWAAGPGAEQESVLARAARNGSAASSRHAGTPADAHAAADAPPEVPLRPAPPGVNLVAELEDEVAQALLRALDADGLAAAPIAPPLRPADADARGGAALPAADAPFAVNLIAAEPAQLIRWVGALDPELLAARYSIALWSGAGPEPEVATTAARLIEEVWVTTEEAAAAVRALVSVPVHGMPPPADPESTARFVRRRLEAIEATGRARRPADPIRGQPKPLARLPLRLRQGPFPAAPGTGQAAREKLRQTVLRVMRPFTAYQQSVNADVVAALAELNGDRDRDRQDARVDRAQALAAARQAAALQARLDASDARLARIEALLSELVDGRRER